MKKLLLFTAVSLTQALLASAQNPVQIVAPNGNDAHDGLSRDSAKLTVYKALQSLPGGDSTHAGTGMILISGTVAAGGPAESIRLMGPNDPNYRKPPLGWLKLTGPITIDCVGPNIAPPHGHRNTCGMHGGGIADSVHPAVWISSSNKPVEIKNLMFVDYLNTYIKYGIDSNNVRTGSGGSSGLSLENVAWNHGSCHAGGGPGMDIGSNSFWIWMKDITASGCVQGIFSIAGASRKSNVTTITTKEVNNVSAGDQVTIANAPDDTFNGTFAVVSAPDHTHFTYNNIGANNTSGTGQVVTAGAAAINIDPGRTGSGSGLIIIDNINLNDGGIRFRPGVNGGGLYVRNVSYEGDFTDPDMPPILVMSTNSSTVVRIDNVEIADPMNAIPAVQVDNSSLALMDAVWVDHVQGVRGIARGGGGWSGTGGNVITPLREGQYGLSGGLVTGGGIDVARRGFSPIAAPGVNIAITDPASWAYDGGGGVISTGIEAPDFTTGAGRATAASGQSFVRFYAANDAALKVGDAYIFGGWVRSVNGRGYAFNAVPMKFTLNGSGYGSGDYCTNGTQAGQVLWPGLVNVVDGQWQWFSGICKILSNRSNAGLLFAGIVDATHPTEFFGPVLIKILAGTKSDNELWEITNNLNSFSPACKQGQMCGVNGPFLVPK